jgi:hypothetical protein
MITQQNQDKTPFSLAWRDCVFLSLILLLSCILYINNLGFYQDDWQFLEILFYSDVNSLSELFRNLSEKSTIGYVRPLQALPLAWMYQLFGDQPLGYHIVNTAIFIVAILLFYLALRELRLPRLVTLTLPLVYGLLPHYSSDHFWIAAFQANLSMALYFASLYADLKALYAEDSRRWSWKIISLVCLFGSALSYEVTLPLFLFNALIIWFYARNSHSFDRHDIKALASRAGMIVSNLLVLALAICYKSATTARAGGFWTDFISHVIYVNKEAIRVGYVDLGVYLPYVAAKASVYHSDLEMLVVGAIVLSAIFAYLYNITGQPGSDLPNIREWLTVLLISPVVYFLGYAIFFTTAYFAFHKTSNENRILIASAIGVAMTFVGGAGVISALMSSVRLRRIFFSFAVALLSFSGFLIINANAKFWGAAHLEQQRILADIRSSFAVFPNGGTLILDGACPYIGSGVVFQNQWDLAGALRVMYRDPTLQAVVVTPRLKVGENSLTSLHWGYNTEFPYGENLLLYDFRRKAIHKLVNAEAARRYFENYNSNYSGDCQGSVKGVGVAPF